MIDNDLMPYLDAFYDIKSLVETISRQGCIFLQIKWLTPPLSFVIQYGAVEQASELLKTFFRNNPKIFKQYKKNSLYFDKKYPFDFFKASPFAGTQEIKIGLENGVVIYES